MKVRMCFSGLNSPDFVIPSEARDLQFAAKCRSLAALGMTIMKGVARAQSGPDFHHGLLC